MKKFKYQVAATICSVFAVFLLSLQLYSKFNFFNSRCLRHPNVEFNGPITIHCNLGRLGNQMCTYATLHGLASLNNRSTRILQCNSVSLDDYFDIAIPRVNEWEFCEHHPHKVNTYLSREDLHISPATNIIKGYKYPCSFTFFNHVRDDIRKAFRFKPEIQTYAQQALHKVNAENRTVVFVGVHVRRTDYTVESNGHVGWLNAFEGKTVGLDYFAKATRYFKKKYSNVLFVAVSDDRTWCRENLPRYGIRVLDESPTPGHDMAILANCNHTIMTYGSFGFWGGYLAGGEVVYFDKFLKPNTEFSTNEFIFDKMYLPEWVGIEPKHPWPVAGKH